MVYDARGHVGRAADEADAVGHQGEAQHTSGVVPEGAQERAVVDVGFSSEIVCADASDDKTALRKSLDALKLRRTALKKTRADLTAQIDALTRPKTDTKVLKRLKSLESSQGKLLLHC